MPATSDRSGAHEARLARLVLAGGAGAAQAAVALLESREPQTIESAVSLLAEQGAVSVDAFDRLADAWATYRHLRNLSWD